MKKLRNFLLLLLIISSQILLYAQTHKHEFEYYSSKQKPVQYYELKNKSDIVPRSKSTKNCTLNKVVYGWHPYWMNGLEANYDWNLLSDLSYFGYSVNPYNGNANSTYNWATAAVVDSALANGVRVSLCVTLFSNHVFFFNDSTSQQTLITNLINLIQQRNAHGVNIDFEEVPSSQKVPLTNFVINLSTQMKTAIPNAHISIALPAVDWSGTFDVLAMLPHIDLFLIMGYDYYYAGSSQAGPTDPLYTHVGTYDRNLSRSITYYLNEGIPSAKLALGLPYYGREWETVSNTVPSNTTGNFNSSRTYKHVKDNVDGYYSNPVYYQKTESNYHIYQFGGAWRQCFINDAYSLGKRYDMVNQRQLAGIGIWALGYDDGYSDLWDLIENKFTNCATVACQGTICDLGGPLGNYYPNENLTFNIAPNGASNLSLTFNSFSLGTGDTLKLFDGTDITASLIGNYFGNNSPGTVVSANNAITLSFKSTSGATGSGWEAVWQCNTDTDTIPPQTLINTTGNWKTDDFIIHFTDTDNAGGSGIDRRFYQVGYLDGTKWVANTNRGFLTDDFSVLDTSLWQSPPNTGNWSISANTLYQSNAALTNTNIYAPLNQTLSNRYLYHFRAKIEGTDANQRFGFHFFADSAHYDNRNNSYFIWFRQSTNVLEFYKVSNNVFSLKKTVNNVVTNTGQWYDLKIVYDRITGDMFVYRDNVLIGDYKDDIPYSTNGNYISFRTGNCMLNVDSLNVYRSRLSSANILAGSTGNKDIRTQNPHISTASGMIKSIVNDSTLNLSPVAVVTVNVDWTPPAAVAYVNDGTTADVDTLTLTTSLSANWASTSDTHSDIHSYWYAVGTSPNDTDVVAWTNNSLSTTVTHLGLNLTFNTVYYFSVKAKNNAGLFSTVVNSNGALLIDSTLIIAANLQTTLAACPDLEVNFSWTYSDTNWHILLADNNMFNDAYFKEVSNEISTTGPIGFVLLSDSTTPLVLIEGQTYYWKMQCDSSFTSVKKFVMPVCSNDTLVAPVICFVTYANAKNRIVWEKPLSNVIDSFYVYRETNILNQFEKIGSVAYSDMSVFDDQNSNPDVQSYKYRLSLVGVNGVESPQSHTHRTIHLSINQGQGNIWNLLWTPYQGMSVQTYNIYRGTNPNNLQLINSLSGSVSQFSDLNAPSGILFYQIEFILPYTCEPSKSIISSLSNIASNGIVNINKRSMDEIRVYPNPVSNNLYIEMDTQSETLFEIYTITGVAVKMQVIKEHNRHVIDVSHLAQGIYILKTTDSNASSLLRFIKL